MSALQALIDYGVNNELTRTKEAQAELDAFRELTRLARIARYELAGTMFVTYQTGGQNFRDLMDECLAKIDGTPAKATGGKVATK